MIRATLTALLILAGAGTAIAFDPEKVAGVEAGIADCPDCDFTGANLQFQCVKTGDLSRARFDDANLKYACMRETILTGTSFRRADLTGANLSDATLSGADMEGAVMNLTLIRGTDLSAAKNLTQAQVSKACGDARTRLPPGLSVNICE